MEELIFKREPGMIESFMIRSNSTIVSIAHCSGHKFDSDIVNKAMNLLIDRHPNLRVNLYYSEKSWEFRPVSNAYIEPKFIYNADSNFWREFVQKISNERFDYSVDRSLFQFYMIQDDYMNTQIIFKYDHTIGDGRSNAIFIDNFLNFYSCAFKDRLYTIESLPFLLSAESLAFPDGYSDDDWKIIKNNIDNLIDSRRSWKSLVDWTPQKTLRNVNVWKDGTKENFILVKRFSKSHKVTIGSIIMASTCFAIVNQFKRDWIKEPEIDMALDIDADLRDRFPKKLGLVNIGCLISIYRMMGIKIKKETKLWDLLLIINEKLKRIFEEKQHFCQKEAYKFIDDNDQHILKNIEKNNGAHCDVNLSNIGHYPFNDKIELTNGDVIKIEKLYCGGGPWAPFHCICCFLIQSIDFFTYTMVHDCGKENEEPMTKFFNEAVYMIENCHLLENFTIDDLQNKFNFIEIK